MMLLEYSLQPLHRFSSDAIRIQSKFKALSSCWKEPLFSCRGTVHQINIDMKITTKTRTEINKMNPNELISCRVFQVGGFFFSSHQYSVQIVQAAWHPLSDSHLVILTSDNTLR
jgi:hypothetical protein